jgi:hypothetical protein
LGTGATPVSVAHTTNVLPGATLQQFAGHADSEVLKFPNGQTITLGELRQRVLKRQQLKVSKVPVPLKPSARVRRPNSDESQILQALRLQMQTAQQESAGAKGTTLGGGQGNSPAMVNPVKRRTTAGFLLLPPTPTPAPGPRLGRSAVSSLKAAVAPTTLPLPPGIHDPRSRLVVLPGIRTVNGRGSGTIFTPEPQYNLFTIKGSGFGAQPGTALLYGPFRAGQVRLQIEFWSDTEIVAKVDPGVTREPDQDNVTLVLSPVGAAQMRKEGFRFRAVRETVILRSIPRSWANLDLAHGGEQVGFGEPGPDESARVGRYLGGNDSFPPGTDSFRIRGLARGFVLDSYQVWGGRTDTNRSFCDGEMGGQYFHGKYDATFLEPDTFVVYWGVWGCHVSPYLLLPGSDYARSDYALAVWVRGPRGVSPMGD